MIIKNKRSYELFLGWVKKNGRLLPPLATTEIEDSYAILQAFRNSLTSGDIEILAYNNDNLDFVVQEELNNVIPGANERLGQFAIPVGVSNFTVTFLPAMTNSIYNVTGSLKNIVDLAPTHKTILFKNLQTTQFDVELSNVTETENYILSWVVKP